MTDQPTSAAAWAPQACTLPTAQRPLRLAEFDTLFTQAVQGVDRPGPLHLRLHLAGDDDLEATVRDLAARESQCCSFFAFTITADTPARVQLDIGVPEAQTAVLDALADRAASLARSW
jgi:hypothetical protein